MLNLSHNRIDNNIDKSKYSSFSLVHDYNGWKIFKKLLVISLILLLVTLFLPWTQNISSKGYVTTLTPDQRPQTINSIIAGRIEKWYIKEGDYVEKGDTILFLSEVKDEYFDPQLLGRTEEQIKLKEQTVGSYSEKVNALENQINALFKTKRIKLKQAENYIRQKQLEITSDSIEYEASKVNLAIAQKQLSRMQNLYEGGLKSLTDLETRKLKVQESQAKNIMAVNKLLSSQNALINAKVELSSIENQYRDKLAKAESEKFATLSKMYDSEALVTKMQNKYENYSVRSGYYYITASQSGFITKAIRSGIGETVKAGEKLVSVMPDVYNLAVSMYVEPIDLPLIHIGNKVRFLFDGWPSIVFSGWPNLSYGTFGGEVVAIDNFISENGKYRILVAPDSSDYPWPKRLRVGAGANGLALLEDVPIWYELWRNLNGFPPDFYHSQTNNSIKEKK